MLGEIGGHLGMFLGASFLDLPDFLDFVLKKLQRNNEESSGN
jgi:hypothetical protein